MLLELSYVKGMKQFARNDAKYDDLKKGYSENRRKIIGLWGGLDDDRAYIINDWHGKEEAIESNRRLDEIIVILDGVYNKYYGTPKMQAVAKSSKHN